MTIFGKILAIFVFLASLVWFGLTVNLYATRAEWKKAYDAKVKENKELATASEELKKQVLLERANIDARQQTADRTVSAIAQQLTEAQKRYEDQLAVANKVADAAADARPILAEYKASIEKVQNQVDSLTTSLSTVTKERDDYSVAAQKAAAKAGDAELQQKVFKDGLDAAQEKIRNLLDARQGGGVAAGADAAFRGEVLKVSGEQLVFSGGLNAGVKVGNVYQVVRNKAPFVIGKVEVTVSNPGDSAGTFTPASGKLSGDYIPLAGDTVQSKTK